jgi:hypothetical protein
MADVMGGPVATAVRMVKQGTIQEIVGLLEGK